MSKTNQSTRRIIELDLLRGFFIAVIVLDHLQFWPSYWQYFTGQGRLWVSAAEGFFLISGLLIGYLRLFKDAKAPLKALSQRLIKRAFMLYVWCVVITFIIVGLSVVLPGDASLLPRLPRVEQVANLPTYLFSVITMQYASDWIYFLRLYAYMLLFTPLFIWLVRRGWWHIALLASLAVYTISLMAGIKEVALQWQVLFFGSALIGWRLELILNWLRQHLFVRAMLVTGVTILTITTMIISYFFVHGWSYVESPDASLSRQTYVAIREVIDPLFLIKPLAPVRVALSFVWFAGLLIIFHLLRNQIRRYLGWLLLSYGTRSLSFYCLHALILPFVVTMIQASDSMTINTIIGLTVLMSIWLLMRLEWMQKLLPR